MVKDVAIRVVGLSKQYHIGGPRKTYNRLGEQLADAFAAPFRRAGKLLRGQATGAAELDEKIWALRDVSFEIKPGEVVGIVGPNGAGKSTLLKIFSRITEPTEGYVDIYGRVGSLLEVGTGFHPELTGRENIYLNAAILGMKRKEIDSKLDEIVAFSGIDKFIDTPVKHYSSGMYVRLAFSVAAHLEPEILLVDEVLAVGDIGFQKKCLGKMDDVAQQGRTVLFVSHNMGLMRSLCQRGILLDQGTISVDGSIDETVDNYLQSIQLSGSQNLAERTDRKGQGQTKLVCVEVMGGSNGAKSVLKTGGFARIICHVSALLPNMSCTIFLYDHDGQPVTRLKSDISGPEDSYNSENGPKFICDIDELLLLPSRYRIDVAIKGNNMLQDYIEGAVFFDVGAGLVNGRPAPPTTKFRVFQPHRWTVPTKDR